MLFTTIEGRPNHKVTIPDSVLQILSGYERHCGASKEQRGYVIGSTEGHETYISGIEIPDATKTIHMRLEGGYGDHTVDDREDLEMYFVVYPQNEPSVRLQSEPDFTQFDAYRGCDGDGFYEWYTDRVQAAAQKEGQGIVGVFYEYPGLNRFSGISLHADVLQAVEESSSIPGTPEFFVDLLRMQEDAMVIGLSRQEVEELKNDRRPPEKMNHMLARYPCMALLE